MSTILPLAEVRERLSPLVGSVERTHERVEITKNGHPVAVLMSYEDLESLLETIDVLAEGETMEEIREALSSPDRYDLERMRETLQARDQLEGE